MTDIFPFFGGVLFGVLVARRPRVPLAVAAAAPPVRRPARGARRSVFARRGAMS